MEVSCLSQSSSSPRTIRCLQVRWQKTWWHYFSSMGEWKAADLGCHMLWHFSPFISAHCFIRVKSCSSWGWASQGPEVCPTIQVLLIQPFRLWDSWCYWVRISGILKGTGSSPTQSNRRSPIFSVFVTETVSCHSTGQCCSCIRKHWTIAWPW